VLTDPRKCVSLTVCQDAEQSGKTFRRIEMYLDICRLYYIHSYMVDEQYESDYYVVDDFGNMVKLPEKMKIWIYHYCYC